MKDVNHQVDHRRHDSFVRVTSSSHLSTPVRKVDKLTCKMRKKLKWNVPINTRWKHLLSGASHGCPVTAPFLFWLIAPLHNPKMFSHNHKCCLHMEGALWSSKAPHRARGNKHRIRPNQPLQPLPFYRLFTQSKYCWINRYMTPEYTYRS